MTMVYMPQELVETQRHQHVEEFHNLLKPYDAKLPPGYEVIGQRSLRFQMVPNTAAIGKELMQQQQHSTMQRFLAIALYLQKVFKRQSH